MSCRRVFILFALFAALPAKAASTIEPIRVGHLDALSGGDAPFGRSVDLGIALAVDEINERGGIRGRKVALLSADDRGSASEAVTAATKLVTRDGVVAILGESLSSKALAVAPVLQRSRIPMLSPGATSVKLTEVGSYIFRLCFIDRFQGRALAGFARRRLGVKQVAVLRDLSSDASVGLSQAFVEAFKAAGGSIVSTQTYLSGDLEFRSQLTAIKALAPDALFLSGYYAESGLIARQASELGIKAPLVGGDGNASLALLPLGAGALEGMYLADHYSPDNRTPEGQHFKQRFTARHHRAPWTPEALGYDAMNLLAAAMRAAKTLSPTDIRDALALTKDFPGVTGKISFDADRNVRAPVIMLRVHDGKFVYHATITP